MKFYILKKASVFGSLLAISACSAVPSVKPDQGRLLATGGVSQIEGSAGTGLVPWAVMTGYGSDQSWGGSAYYTRSSLNDFEFESRGAAVALRDRIEISYAEQRFDVGDTGPRLGLPEDYTFEQDIFGAKVRVLGNVVYDQDSWLPQIAVGAQYKKNKNGGLVSAIGAEDDEGLDLYVSGTKLFLDDSVLLTGTARRTKANQFGLLGFGGDQGEGHSIEYEGSAAIMLSRKFVVGADYRTKPDNLGFADEEDALAVYGAYFPSKNISLTAAYVDLGDIALQGKQTGVYGSVQIGF